MSPRHLAFESEQSPAQLQRNGFTRDDLQRLDLKNESILPTTRSVAMPVYNVTSMTTARVDITMHVFADQPSLLSSIVPDTSPLIMYSPGGWYDSSHDDASWFNYTDGTFHSTNVVVSCIG